MRKGSTCSAYLLSLSLDLFPNLSSPAIGFIHTPRTPDLEQLKDNDNPMIRMSELYEVLAGSCISFVCSLSVNLSEPLKLQYSTRAEDSCQQVATRVSYIPTYLEPTTSPQTSTLTRGKPWKVFPATRERQNYSPSVNAHVGKRCLP